MSALQKLIQATGKSADEIMEWLGKAGNKADDVSEAAVMKNLQKEAADASVPVGSGKNLEALQRAQDEMTAVADAKAGIQKAQQGSLEAPFVDAERNINAEKLDLDFGGAAPAQFDPMSIPGSKPTGMIPPKASPIQESIAAPKSLAATADELKGSIDGVSNKQKLTTAGVLGLGALGTLGLMSGEDDIQVPFVPQSKMAPPAAPQIPAAAPQAPTAPVSPAKRAASVDAVQKAEQAVAQEPEAEPEMADYLAQMKAAQDAQADNQMINNLLRASTQIGAGIAGSGAKADYTMADALDKTAGQKVANVKGLMETEASAAKLKQSQLDMKDEGKLRDAGSDISKTARDLAKQFGIKVTDATSAKQLQDAGLPLGTLLSTKMAADARKEAAQLQREQMAASKADANKLKVQGSVDKQVSQLLKSKDYESYNTAKDALAALEMAIASGDKTASGSAFMQFAKIAQGDNSVVRDGDMAVLAGGYNYTSPTEMIAKLNAKAKGGNFNEQELKQMKAVAARIQQIKGQRVAQLMSPIIQRAQASGLNLAESLDPRMVEEFSPKSAKTDGLTTDSKADQMVTVRRKSDGATKMMSAKKAAEADPSKYEIIK